MSTLATLLRANLRRSGNSLKAARCREVILVGGREGRGGEGRERGDRQREAVRGVGYLEYKGCVLCAVNDTVLYMCTSCSVYQSSGGQ